MALLNLLFIGDINWKTGTEYAANLAAQFSKKI